MYLDTTCGTLEPTRLVYENGFQCTTSVIEHIWVHLGVLKIILNISKWVYEKKSILWELWKCTFFLLGIPSNTDSL